MNQTERTPGEPGGAIAGRATGSPEAAREARRVRVLLVDTSTAAQTGQGPTWDDVIDYTACADLPAWLRSVERRCRIDFSLARRAVRQARHADVLLAGSEKVGIPLALMRTSRPVVCLVHQVASPLKRVLLKSLNIPGRWSRIGYQCNADRDLLASYYGVPSDHLVQFKAAPLEAFQTASQAGGSYVLSLGTAKRDYATLLSALQGLPGVLTHLYVASRYLDPYRGKELWPSKAAVEFKAPAGHSALPDIYAAAKFVVLPLERSWQYSAGTTTALEAHAAGKAVVATRTPGMSDFVIDGVTGILVPAGDSTAMREAIAKLWDDPRMAAEMGRAGRAHVERAFNPARVDATIRRAYVEACDEYRRSR